MRIFAKRWLLILCGFFLLFVQEAQSQDVVYLRTNLFGNYWGQNGNALALDRAFGSGGWTRRYFETADIAELFSAEHKVIFVDGSNMGTCDFVKFFEQHQLSFEQYVDQGGALFINIAASECKTDPINLGFDGVVSTYNAALFDGEPVDAGHQVFKGPHTPAYSDLYYGSNLALNNLTGGNLSSILVAPSGELTLGEKLWGKGLVLFGGITLEWIGQHSMWGPEPNLSNLYDNILLYLYAHGTEETCTELPVVITQDIEINLNADGLATLTPDQIDNGSSSACGELILTIDKTNFNCSVAGDNIVTLRGTDVNNNSVSAPAVVTVKDVTPPVVLTKNMELVLDEAGMASISASDINNNSSDACGIASMTLDISEFECSTVGDNQVTLTVSDNNGNTASAIAVVTVIDNIIPVVITQDLVVELDENGMATISADDINMGSSDACGIAQMILDQTAFTCDNIGANTVTLTVTDNNGNVNSATAVVNVENDAPVILSINIVDEPTVVGENLVVSATYEDNDLVSATWDWDDGSSTEGGFFEGIITGAHQYTEAGNYNVTLILEDGCGQQTSESINDIIIVNPSGGFVTGGGKIKSPKGAWLADKDVSGMLYFGFVAKYHKKDTKPKGVAVIKIKDANVKFKSKSIDWLVVNSGYTAMFEGTGKDRKHNQHYRFRISAVDEGHGWKSEDKFRFQLWKLESGELVYDNQPGDPVDAEATEKISKGDIVIHKFKEYKPEEEKEDEDEDKEEEESSSSKVSSSSNTEQVKPTNQVTLKLYPNPVKRVLHVTIDRDIADFNASLKVSIIDARGNVRVLENQLAISGPRVLEYDVSQLKRGIYYLLVEGANVRKSTRFIKY